jgi:uridine kinase
MVEYAPVISAIAEKRKALSRERTLLVGISGIDASGKGFITAKLAHQLEERGWRIASIGVDGWLNLPHVRFAALDPATHFYEQAFRFEEMFEQLVLPLRDHRSINLEADFTEEAATIFRKHRYDFRAVDIVLLEGIFLLKPAYRHHFDLTVWIDCSFATALKRAITRCQEKLPPRETIAAFETIYFPAQRFHIDRDDPRAAANIVISNDGPIQQL